MQRLIVAAICAATAITVHARDARTLQIYFVDVEGGQSTLVVTPERHTLLIDAGYASDGRFDAI